MEGCIHTSDYKRGDFNAEMLIWFNSYRSCWHFHRCGSVLSFTLSKRLNSQRFASVNAAEEIKTRLAGEKYSLHVVAN